MEKIPKERIERVARIYKSNKEASRALGIALGSFARICRRYGVQTPYMRRQHKGNRKAPSISGQGFRSADQR